MDHSKAEQEMLRILAQPELPTSAGDSDSTVDDTNGIPELDDKARRLMAQILRSEMPTPEEIATYERIAIHNAKVQHRREENLSRRAARRSAGIKPRKRSRDQGKRR